MSGADGATRPGPKGRPPGGPTEPFPRVSLKRLAGLVFVLVVAAATGESLLCPFRVGWQRASELIALEDAQAALRAERTRLTEQLRWRTTDGSKSLEALKQFELGKPGGRVVELTPSKPAPKTAQRRTLAERAQAWRESARLRLYCQWRVLARYWLDRRLPPPAAA